jgi:hypothetical protein
MIHIYYIITLVLTALTAFHAPKLVAQYNKYKTRIKHQRQSKLRDIIREEIRNVLIELKNEQ